MGEYLWYFIGVAVAMFFKNAIEKFVSGLTFLYGNDTIWMMRSMLVEVNEQQL